MFNFNNSYIDIDERIFSRVKPERPDNPKEIIFNKELAEVLGVSGEEAESLLSGDTILENWTTIAQAYAGHQFGYLNILGDGRALLLGEHIDPDGNRWDIQLKGSGRTPYSRGGDGKATLKSMLREYLISFAMDRLGIPTTKSLAVISTGNPVYREDVNQGAVLTRVAKSHIRVGTFQYIAMQGDYTLLKEFANYTIKRHYPELYDGENRYLELLKIVTSRQIDLILNWMRVGFIHGVMNTDNVSIICETIDYGPCAFMDIYDPETVFSSIDKHGRYSFGNQEYIGQWNMARFAETLIPLVDKDEETALKLVNNVIEWYKDEFKLRWFHMLGKKLGIVDITENDRPFILEFLEWMKSSGADYTQTFSSLELLTPEDINKNWYTWWAGKGIDWDLIKRENPIVIPRNHIVEEVLDKADSGDMKPFNKFLKVLQTPYERANVEKYNSPPEVVNREYKTYCGT